METRILIVMVLLAAGMIVFGLRDLTAPPEATVVHAPAAPVHANPE
jgi:hypothetical protein